MHFSPPRGGHRRRSSGLVQGSSSRLESSGTVRTAEISRAHLMRLPLVRIKLSHVMIAIAVVAVTLAGAVEAARSIGRDRERRRLSQVPG